MVSPDPRAVRAAGASRTVSGPSARDARFQIEDHLPEPIDLAALDDFKRFEPSK